MSDFKSFLKVLLRSILPRRAYNLILARPVLVIMSRSLYRKVHRINMAALFSDPEFRGDWGGIIRKEAHIIDKGLQLSGRKRGHSLDRAASLRKSLMAAPVEGHTALWASEILSMHGALQNEQLESEAYSGFDFICPDGDAQYISDVIRTRRSIRHFSFVESPSQDLVRQAIDATVWASSSCNRQTIISYVAFDENLAALCAKQNKGATGISGTFAFISVCYDTRSYFLPQESLTGMIDVSLGFQNALLLMHAFGLGACVLNWSHASKQEEFTLRTLLDIPEHCEIAFNVVVGVPRVGAPPPGRKSDSEYMQVKG